MHGGRRALDLKEKAEAPGDVAARNGKKLARALG